MNSATLRSTFELTPKYQDRPFPANGAGFVFKRKTKITKTLNYYSSRTM